MGVSSGRRIKFACLRQRPVEPAGLLAACRKLRFSNLLATCRILVIARASVKLGYTRVMYLYAKRKCIYIQIWKVKKHVCDFYNKRQAVVSGRNIKVPTVYLCNNRRYIFVAPRVAYPPFIWAVQRSGCLFIFINTIILDSLRYMEKNQGLWKI